MYDNLCLMLFKCTVALSSSTHCKALPVMCTYSSGSSHYFVNDLHLRILQETLIVVTADHSHGLTVNGFFVLPTITSFSGEWLPGSRLKHSRLCRRGWHVLPHPYVQHWTWWFTRTQVIQFYQVVQDQKKFWEVGENQKTIYLYWLLMMVKCNIWPIFCHLPWI